MKTKLFELGQHEAIIVIEPVPAGLNMKPLFSQARATYRRVTSNMSTIDRWMLWVGFALLFTAAVWLPIVHQMTKWYFGFE